MTMTNVNGIYRPSNQRVCVNGVWRDSIPMQCINGVWRSENESIQPLSPDSIRSFRFIYHLSKDLRDRDFPMMEYNPEIDRVVEVTGKRPIEISLEPKSILLRYQDSHPEIEGLIVYSGALLALLEDGSTINVLEIYDSIWNPLEGFEITVSGYTLYESYGPPVMGWNQFLSRIHNLPSSADLNKKMIRMNSYYILPSYQRDPSFDHFLTIGIARNMTDRDHNMVGSNGLLDHTVESIRVNGIEKPFQIEIEGI